MSQPHPVSPTIYWNVTRIKYSMKGPSMRPCAFDKHYSVRKYDIRNILFFFQTRINLEFRCKSPRDVRFLANTISYNVFYIVLFAEAMHVVDSDSEWIQFYASRKTILLLNWLLLRLDILLWIMLIYSNFWFTNFDVQCSLRLFLRDRVMVNA